MKPIDETDWGMCWIFGWLFVAAALLVGGLSFGTRKVYSEEPKAAKEDELWNRGQAHLSGPGGKRPISFAIYEIDYTIQYDVIKSGAG